MSENTIYAVFEDSYYAQTKPIRQYDEGIELVISSNIELPEYYQVHFANDRFSEDSVAQMATNNTVTVPTSVTQSGDMVYAWIYLEDAESAVTRLEAQIPVRKRAKLPDGTITPEDRTLIEEAIEALNTAVEQTAQDVTDADASALSASQSADRAEQAAAGVESAVTQAQGYAESASESEIKAKEYADSAEASVISTLGRISFDIDSDGQLIYSYPDGE